MLHLLTGQIKKSIYHSKRYEPLYAGYFSVVCQPKMRAVELDYYELDLSLKPSQSWVMNAIANIQAAN
jgi:hypothetical protein